VTGALKYSQIVSLNRELGQKLSSRPFKIRVLTNVTVNQLREILEYSLRSEGVNATVSIGTYDNILQESRNNAGYDAIIIFWDGWNYVDGLFYRIGNFTASEEADLLTKFELDAAMVLDNLKSTPLVLLNTFTSGMFGYPTPASNAFQRFCQRADQYLRKDLPTNARILEVCDILQAISVDAAIDWRLFYSAKSPYTIAFFKEYATLVKAPIRALYGKAKKVLVLDCDNTLWGGIIGEDGLDGVILGSGKPHGAIYAEIQHIALTLQRRGVLLALCSKNNPEDVDEMLQRHPEMVIKDHHLAIKRVNWSDKATNIRAIAEALNVGLDSLVFVDDSSFEIELLREQLPEVATLLVPSRIVDYPRNFRTISNLFFQLAEAPEDRNKTEQYRLEASRQELRKTYDNIEDYLRSLSLRITIYADDQKLAARIAQLSQKTNQFNLTTRRYAEQEITTLIEATNATVYAFRVSDKFGDYGIAGAAILRRKDSRTTEIDTFLMSCRVLGRNVESAFLQYLLGTLRAECVETVQSAFIATAKNGQVASFYDEAGFILTASDGGTKNYAFDLLAQALPAGIDYVSITQSDE